MPSKDPRVIKAYRDKHYQQNKQQYLDRNQRNRKARRDYILAEKSKPCADCGGSFPYYVMDFDHRPDEEKMYEPARLSVSVGLDTIAAELAKCDVVCSNCHRIRSAEREQERQNRDNNR